jgi:hypothetical protein
MWPDGYLDRSGWSGDRRVLIFLTPETRHL